MKVENWLTTKNKNELAYDYWNTPELEISKPFYVQGNDFNELNKYLEQSGLLKALRCALGHIVKLKGKLPEGRGLDVACGTFWSAKLLLEETNLTHLVGVDFSEHRITQLACYMVDAYEINPDSITLAIGSFYDLKIEDGTIDFILLSQSLHHAEAPLKLLQEVWRVLSPDGVVVLIGEEPYENRFSLKKRIAYVIISRLPEFLWVWWPKKLLQRLGVISPPPDIDLGDHYYTSSMYRKMFKEASFVFYRGNEGLKSEYFLLWKNIPTI